MEEIIIKKVSIFKTHLDVHLLETVRSFIKNNKEHFNTKSWACAAKTSVELTKNILFDVSEFVYIRKTIEQKIEETFIKNFNKTIPFIIYESWINVLGEHGYQEFHIHNSFGSGVLYITDENSNIEFAVFPDEIRKQLQPKKGDLLIFDGKTYHRALDSSKERISLAFNFKTQ